MEEGPVIQVINVSKSFLLPHEKITSVKSAFVSLFRSRNRTKEVQQALKDISFEIKKGEFFGVVGRNGSGKSTLLKILAGIYQPSRGKVETQGKLVPFIELGVGFNPELTGRENVYLNGAMLGFSEKQVNKMYKDIVDFAELERFMDQKLKNYSSGMQVRLAFSVAIRAEADILLIDEVLAVGDAAFQRKCLNYFRELKREEKTVVFVSHDMDSVRQFCDRAVLIEKNEIVDIGPSDRIAELYSRMFAEEARAASKKEKEQTVVAKDRWGSQAVTIANQFISEKIVDSQTNTLTFGGDAHFNENQEDVVIGFKILDGSGKAITGTNSMLLRQRVGAHTKGSKVTFSWQIPNVFSNGDYVVGLALVTPDNEALDVWNDALTFQVHKSIKTPYVITPEIILNLEG